MHLGTNANNQNEAGFSMGVCVVPDPRLRLLRRWEQITITFLTKPHRIPHIRQERNGPLRSFYHVPEASPTPFLISSSPSCKVSITAPFLQTRKLRPKETKNTCLEMQNLKVAQPELKLAL
jgi:hypothetical protein